jgi:hypothetical protein
MEHGGVDLVKYVHTVLREKVPLKDIATSLGITHP